ncbi:hypothetical protein PGIGA_G00213340 [Pangasianodon gigas]|uniref:Uncharacterized protein n=1 Tax=Pangasianodon gigas TaxID=30993 RepID=A0ACC5WGI5_PANGG|nr:hypothetical protein [Pangasianodon gigas]
MFYNRRYSRHRALTSTSWRPAETEATNRETETVRKTGRKRGTGWTDLIFLRKALFYLGSFSDLRAA